VLESFFSKTFCAHEGDMHMKIRYTSFLFTLAALLITSGCAAKSALMQASSKGDSQTVQKLIREGANI